MPYVRVG